MKTIVMLFIFCSTFYAQQKAEIESWLIDPKYIKNSVYAVNVGHDPYVSFLRSLAGLAEKLRMSGTAGTPDGSARISAAQKYSFGKVNVTYPMKSYRELLQRGDSLDFQSTVSYSVELQFSTKTKKCFMKTGSEIVDRANDETFNPFKYNSKTSSGQSLSYEFKDMTFSDLLAELEREGVKIYFRTEFDITYSLATYSLSKVKQ